MSKGKVLLLLSGGFDSPVAGKLLQDEQFEVLGVHFSQEPFTDNGPEIKAKSLARMLNIVALYVVNIGMELLHISESSQPRNYFIHMKRLMYRLATEIGMKEKADFLATGESLGQVSSQTLHNLCCLSQALSDLPILRPLLGFTKREIVDLSRSYGFFETSCGPETCDRLGHRYPETHAKLETILEDEKRLDLSSILKNPLRTVRKVTDFSSLDSQSEKDLSLETSGLV